MLLFAPIQLTFLFCEDGRPQVRAHDPSPLILIRYDEATNMTVFL